MGSYFFSCGGKLAILLLREMTAETRADLTRVVKK